jgi:hypothetical protein
MNLTNQERKELCSLNESMDVCIIDEFSAKMVANVLNLKH